MRSTEILSLWFLLCCFFLIYELQNTGAYRLDRVQQITKADFRKGHIIIEDLDQDGIQDIIVLDRGESFYITNFAKNFEPQKTISLSQLNLGSNSHIFHLVVTELKPGKKSIVLFTDSFDLALLNHQGELIWSARVPELEISSQISQFPPEELDIVGTYVPIHHDDENGAIVLALKIQFHPVRYYCFDGKTGAIRWASKDFEQPLPLNSTKNHLNSGQNWRLGVSKVSTHFQNLDWSIFQQSMIETLPHYWAEYSDTSLKLAHFKRSFQAVKGNQPENEKLPNCVVFHSSFGIQAVHLYTGHVLTELPLQMENLYDAIRDNTTLYRIWVKEDCKGEVAAVFNHNHDHQIEFPICTHTIASLSQQLGTENQFPVFQARPPLVLTGQPSKGDFLPVNLNPKQIIFLANDGTISGTTVDGRPQFKIQFNELHWTWDENPPILKKVHLRKNSRKEFILAQYQGFFVIVDEKGHVVSKMQFSTMEPTVAIFAADFNGDGITDFILDNEETFNCYTSKVAPSFGFSSLVLICLILLIGGVMAKKSKTLAF